MILSDKTIKLNNILTPCEENGRQRGMSYGLSHCGYDVRASLVNVQADRKAMVKVGDDYASGVVIAPGKSLLIGIREHFNMPTGVAGFVRDKSTWSRQGLFVAQAVLEPGWRGYLTLRVFNGGDEDLTIAEGDPIAQAVFMWMDTVPERTYSGKYQGQERGPQGPRFDR